MTTLVATERAMGRLELLYRERMKRDRERLPALGYYFDDEEADRVVDFVESELRHHKGEWAGQLFELDPWQRELLREVFGWFRADGTRRFRTAWVEIARKNGKTEIGAAVGVYMLVFDREPGAEVYSSATKRDQARILFDAGKAMVKQSGNLQRYIKTHRANMSCEALGSKFEPLGADGDTLDGLNAHCNLIDEIHAHKDRLVYDVLVTSMGARRQPLTFIITTAGTYDPEQIGWLLHQKAEQVLEGVVEDESFFAYIAAADPDDDWRDPGSWEKANPNLGVSVKREYMEEMARKAESEPSFLNTFLRLHLNIWTQQVTRWIAMEHWQACARKMRLELFKGRPCFVGLDLSTTTDITALALAFPPTEEGEDWGLFTRFWVPEYRVQEEAKRGVAPYDRWVQAGMMHETPGNVIDYGYITADIAKLADTHDIEEIAYDPWNATQTATELEADGYTMVEVRQGYASISEPSKEFERLVVSGKLHHPDNPVMRWMMNNVAVATDPAGNIKPNKDPKRGSRGKIDGVVAAIMAIARAIVWVNARSVYNDRGIRYI